MEKSNMEIGGFTKRSAFHFQKLLRLEIALDLLEIEELNHIINYGKHLLGIGPYWSEENIEKRNLSRNRLLKNLNPNHQTKDNKETGLPILNNEQREVYELAIKRAENAKNSKEILIEITNREQNKEKNLAKNMKFKLLNEFGFLNTKEFKELNRSSQKKLISKILDCNDRTAQAFLNGDDKYDIDVNNKEEFNKIVKQIKLK